MASYTKWNKYKVMRGDSKLTDYLPETLWFSKANLKKATDSFAECILKPSGSAGGNGVMMLRKKSEGFQIQSGKSIRTVSDFEGLYQHVNHKIKRGYIIQRRINLAKVAGRLFDSRVMVQRHPEGTKWSVTGKLAKIGGKGFIITNTALSGGYVLPLGTALQRSNIPPGKIAGIAEELDRIALQTVHTLYPSYRYIRSVGIDFGLDGQGRIWIIEANFAPSRALFNKLKDKSMYGRIIAYKK